MAYSYNTIFSSLLRDERELSKKYADILLLSAKADIQSKLQYIQRSNNETVAMLLTEATGRGYKINW